MIRRITSVAIGVLTLAVQICGAQETSRSSKATGRAGAPSVDWSRAVVESTMRRYPNPAELGSWGYAKALYLFGEYLVWKRTGDPRYLQYVKGWLDAHVDAQGNLDHNTDSLDSMMPGNLLLLLYQETGEEKYKLAADKIRQRFNTYPRTADGGLWHATAASRQHQLWGDGVFMSMPFLVRYGRLFGDSAYANDEAARQLIVYAGHLHSPEGLLYHAYDESGGAAWADPATHHSAEFWCRAMGWFGMTLVDVLDVLPANDPRRPQLISILRDLVRGLAKYQDSQTGLWYQVVNKGSDPGNWLETSSSSMYSYIISLAVKRGYVDKSFEAVAKKGYAGVLTKLTVDSEGMANISDICEGTNVADLAYYFARKRNVNDFHGLGAFLIMNEHFLTSASAMELTRPPATPLQPRLSLQPASMAMVSAPQSNGSSQGQLSQPSGPPPSSGVKILSGADVRAAFEKGGPLLDKDGHNYWALAGRRDKPGQSELHEKDLDIFYVLQGSATFITGGKMVDGKTTAPGEVRGTAIEGGETHTLSKDDVVIIPPGVPHWFKDVQGLFLYYVVKVQQP
jgi:unsaturated rhamnogalacturonyl hydrolase